MWEMHSESAHGHCLKRIHCSTAGAGGYQTALHHCERPLMDWGGGGGAVFVVRPHAPNREVRTVTVRYEYMYRATPNIYTHILGLQQTIILIIDYSNVY